MKNLMMLLLVLTVGGSNGCGSSGTSSGDTSPGNPITLTVTGATVEECTVYGSNSTVLGTGTPSGVVYEAGDEESAIVQCGDLAALFRVGDESVTLTAESTQIASLLLGGSMGPGTALVAEGMAGVGGSTEEGALVQSSLADFITALYSVDDNAFSGDASSLIVMKNSTGANSCGTTKTLVCHVPSNGSGSYTICTTDTSVNGHPGHGDSLGRCVSDTPCQGLQDVIKTLINMGQPVVIENVGTGKTISACTDAAAIALYGTGIKATNATAVGLTGCLIYHQLFAITNLNNPFYDLTPETVSSFRSVATETGVVQELLNSCALGKHYTLTSIHDLMFSGSKIGYGGLSEDDEGVRTTQTVAAADLTSFASSLLTSLLAGHTTLADFQNLYHTGYNPSGGWEINATATLQSLPLGCVDSDPSTACAITPLRWSCTTSTCTQDTAGPYILRMEYLNGGFQNYAYPINMTTSKPLRDADFQPVQWTGFVAANYSAVDVADPFYNSALNPIAGGGSSCPYANTDFLALPLCAGMSDVTNAYLWPSPEITVRHAAVLMNASSVDNLTGLRGFTFLKLFTQGLAATPLSSGLYAIVTDHGKTVGQWEDLVTTWLQSGTISASFSGTTQMDIDSSGSIALTITTCQTTFTGGGTENCSISSTLAINPSSKTTQSDGYHYTVTGAFTVSGTTVSGTFHPTGLTVALDGKSGSFTGDTSLLLPFTGSSIANKLGSQKNTVSATPSGVVGN